MIPRMPARSFRATALLLRGLHTQAKVAPYNVVFDIDGVLIKGHHAIPQTRKALQLLWENNVPYIFLTNGGGVLESEKAEQLSKKLGVPVNPDHLIVSHSPMRALVPEYKNKNVMVVGGEQSSCKHVAETYGFKQVVTPEEVHAVHPSVCPISSCEMRPVPMDKRNLRNIGKPVHAVMVFHDSVDWGRDLQLCLDALVSKDGALGTIKESEELHTTKQSVPLYFSNPDVNLTGQELEYTTFGKPMEATYKYAESLLEQIAPMPTSSDGQPVKRTVYAVGDNPYADIAGANAYGWKSVLVKTGVFRAKGDENHHLHPATAVVDHVEDAVRWIIAQENLKKLH
ncbi:hypothetical protein BGZ58_008587 [Dissophora ornata]|nr:hypothetical protein BGZ58_008587 [Dissophora ornata]